MPLVRCEYCRDRVRPAQLKIHQKRCKGYRRALKAGLVGSEVESNSDSVDMSGLLQDDSTSKVHVSPQKAKKSGKGQKA